MHQMQIRRALFLSFIIIAVIFATFPRGAVSSQSRTLTFKPVADATLRSSNLGTNYGRAAQLSVDGSPVIRTYLRFNVTGLNGAAITGAKLRLWVVDDSHSGFDVATVSSNNWGEYSITYRNAPAIGSLIRASGGYGVNQWIEIDVTGAVSREGQVSLALTTTADTTTALASRETGANAPQLVLTLGSVQAATATPTQIFLPTVTNTPNPTPTEPPKSGSPLPYGQSGYWNMVFSDEFDGASLDLNKWEPNWLAGNDTAITKPINGMELSCYDPGQVSVSGGNLRLSAVARPCRANNGVTYNYASGIVTSYPHFQFTYGYMEARVWLDGSTNVKNWPAFWADGTGTWPTTGEIDVMEGLEGSPAWHYHWGTPSNHQQVGSHPPMSTRTGWHVFAADWEPGIIRFYYDGVFAGEVTTNVVGSQMFLILNYGISTEIAPPIQVPSTFLVDYVRVWKPVR